MTSRTLAQALGLVLTGMFFAAGAAHAGDAPQPQAPSRAAGVQVAIDPATGKLREPTAAERAAYSKAFQARQARLSAISGQPLTNAAAKTTLRKVTLGNGVKATGMRLPQSRMTSLVATRAADGTITIQHDDAAAPAAPQAPEATR